MTAALLIIVIVLLVFLITLVRDLFAKIELFHRETLENERGERAELNDRFMSRDLAEYNFNSQGRVPVKQKPPTNFLQEARERAIAQSSYDSTSFGGDS